MNSYYLKRRLLKVFLLITTCIFGASVGAQTYTTIANGNWNSAATWQGGVIPPNMNPLPAGATVNIRHTVNFNIGGNITNNGTISIQPVAGTTARLNVPTGINVENFATGRFIVIDGSYVQFRFVPGNNGQPYAGTAPGAALQAGSFKNIGGFVECRNFFVEIAQDWTNESGGVRVYENGCIYTGQNFSLSGASSIDTLIGTNLSIGWHGSGNYSLSDGFTYYQGFRCQLAGTSGSFQLSSGSAWGDIDYIMLRNQIVPFNGGGLIEASSSLNVNDPAVSGTVNLNLDALHTGTFIQNGRFIGTRTSTWPSSPLNFFPGNCPAGGAPPVVNVDLSLTKTVNTTACYNSGDSRTFTLTVTNTDDNHTATDVIVNDLLPAGFTFVSSTGDGAYNATTGVWTIGNIFAGQTRTRTINVTVSGTVDRINTASFGTLQQTDPNLSNNTSAVTVPACVTTYSISGTVFNDADGLTDGNVDGSGTNAGGLNAVLVDPVSGNVLAVTPVAANGTYSFTNQNAGTYSILITTSSATVGSAAPAVVLPSGWVNTGEDCCDNTGSDGTVNGTVSVTVTTSNVINANFGIERTPESDSKSESVMPTQSGTITQGSVSTNVTGSDPEDGILGNSNPIVITSFPANATMLYNGVAVTVNQVITGFSPALLSFTGITLGSNSVVFEYAFLDAAQVQDPTPATYTLNWAVSLPATGFELIELKVVDKGVYVQWKTETEQNGNRFVIERSANGLTFSPRGIVKAKGESQSQTRYGFVDTLAGSNGQGQIFYYRIRQEDAGGKFTYSNIMSYRLQGLATVSFFPNPFVTAVNIRLCAPVQSTYRIRLLDLQGRTIQELKQSVNSGSNMIQLEVKAGAGAGLYMIELIDENTGTRYTQKLKKK